MTDERQLDSPDACPASPCAMAEERALDDIHAVRDAVRAQFEGARGAVRAALFLGAALFTAGFDQLTKYLVYYHVPPGPQSLEVIPGGLWLCHVYNKGVAWGMFAHRPELVSAVAVATALVVAGCGLWGRFGWRTYVIGLGLVFGGAIGNLIDRAVRPKGVLDFIDVGWWPQFNVADAGVVVGAALVGLMILRATAIEERAIRHAVAEGPAHHAPPATPEAPRDGL
jgi:signal peptidase II